MYDGRHWSGLIAKQLPVVPEEPIQWPTSMKTPNTNHKCHGLGNKTLK